MIQRREREEKKMKTKGRKKNNTKKKNLGRKREENVKKFFSLFCSKERKL